MSSIFPVPDHVGQQFTIGTTTYQWTGYAWIKVSESTQLVNLTLQNLTATNSLSVTTTTNAISTTTGALQVVGGVGIGQDVWIGGMVHIANTSTIDNAEIITTSTLVKYVQQPLFVAGTDTVITTSTVGFIETVKIWNTGTLQSVTDRGHTTTNQVVISNATPATSVGSGALVIAGGISAGGDLWLGGTIYSGGVPVITTTTLVDSFQSGADIRITNTSSFTGPVIIIANTSTFQSVTGRGSTTTNQVFFANTTNSTSSSTGAVVISGGLGVAGRINSESIQIADTIMDSGMVLVNTTDTVVVDMYPIGQYRSAKYLIQIDDGTGVGANFETIEILLLVDNNKTVYATEYAVLSSNGELGEFAADVQNDNILRLYFTAYQASSKTITIFRTGMSV